MIRSMIARRLLPTSSRIAFLAPATSWAETVDQPGVDIFEFGARLADHHEAGQPVVEAPQGQGQFLVAGCLGQQVVEVAILIGVAGVGLVVVAGVSGMDFFNAANCASVMAVAARSTAATSRISRSSSMSRSSFRVIRVIK
jgi:hypothetical protein